MLSCLLSQLLQKDKRIFELILRRYTRKRAGATEIRWTFEELQELFVEIVRDQSLRRSILFVIDGIDESPLRGSDGEISRAKFLQFFLDTIRSAPTAKVKVIFLSRLEDDIRSALRKLPLIVMHTVNSEDIARVVEVGIESILGELSCLEDSDSESNHTSSTSAGEARGGLSLFHKAEKSQDDLIQYIRQYLIDNADGVILWVSSVITHVQMQLGRAFCTLSELAAEIKTLSTELSSVYATIVQNIVSSRERSSTVALAQRALLWVRTNPVPGKFYVHDLIEVLAIDQHQDGDGWAAVKSWSSFNKQLTRLCGPFLEIVNDKKGWNCDPYDPVQLLHQTVKTFLDDPQASKPLYLSPEESAMRFESDCLRYIQKVLPETPCKPHPLLAPATANLDEWITDITTFLEERPLLNFILTFNPKLACRIPARYMQLLLSLLTFPAARGGLGLGSISKLFDEACSNGRTNAVCSLFAIYSSWLHPWEWFLMEPEIIGGALQAGESDPLPEMTAINELQKYIRYRGILTVEEHVIEIKPEPFSFLEWMGVTSGRRATPSIDDCVMVLSDTQQAIYSQNSEVLASPEDKHVAESAPTSVDLAKRSAKEKSDFRAVNRAVNEVLSFWLHLNARKEFLGRHAFKGSSEAHLSECPAIARRMAIIRATVLESGTISVRAERRIHGRRLPFPPSNGLRVQGLEPTRSVANLPLGPLFRDALSRIEEAPREDSPPLFSDFVWKEKLRTVIENGSDSYEEHGDKARYYFSELPPILPSVYPRDPSPVAQCEAVHQTPSSSGGYSFSLASYIAAPAEQRELRELREYFCSR